MVKTIFKRILKKRRKYRGCVDTISGNYLLGWACNTEYPEEKVKVTVFYKDKIIAEGIANEFREDLLKAKIGDGFHAFKIKLPEYIFNLEEEVEIQVFIGDKNFELNNSPFKIIKKYLNWINKYERPLLEKIKNAPLNFLYNPKISIIMPVYNSPEKFLRKAIESVINQIYPNWELCIADDASTETHVIDVLNEYQNKFPERIKVIFREKNGHICEASNSALSLATGEYIALLDHDDELAPHALYMVAEAVNQNPQLKIIYSDEDKIDEEGIRSEPHFKPDWNPDLLLSQNYIAHLLVIKKEIVDKIGGFRKGVEGAQDHDLVLRASLHCKENEIYHIPQILYHWRVWEKSTAKTFKAKEYTEEAGIKVITDYLISKGVRDFKVVKGKYPNTYRVVYKIPDPPPLVSIIIPTKDQVNLLKRCIYSIINKTKYPNYEIIIVNHDSESVSAYKFFNELYSSYNNIKILRYSGEFNFSLINNFAVNYAKGDLLLFLNNDTEVINPEWLTELVSHAIREEIGCVGAKLYYPDGTIQHAGVILGLGGVAGHSHKHINGKDPGYFRRLHLIQNISAVTAACLMVKKNIFFKVGGFDCQNLKVAFNDVDFCLKVSELGYRNLWTPYAELYHHESKSRGYEDTPEKSERFKREIEFMKKKWGEVLMKDPYYNPNLTLDREDFSIKD
ncbi:MAG: glycosyltransferase family 2 protein [Candidatus Micrarchaeia archaeon]